MIQRSLASLNDLIRHLMTAIANANLYSLQHHQVDRLAEMGLNSLNQAIGSESELSLMVIESDLVVDDIQLENNLYVSRFVKALKFRGIGHLKFITGVTKDELLNLVSLMLKPHDAAVEVSSTEHIRFGTVEVRFSESGERDAEQKHPTVDIADMAAEEAARFAEIYEEVRKRKKLRLNGIFEIVTGFVHAFKQASDPLLALAPLRALDEYTFTHSTNVCILNLAQAMALGIDGPLLHDIGTAAMLHDMGKLYVPEEILTKPDKLEEHEWEMMRQHPVKGAQYLLDAPGVPRLAVVTAFEHHLKFDLSGYPAVAPGWNQNLCSQMTTVSDVFDALRTKRAYQGSMGMGAIKKIMTDLTGTALHPVLVRNFFGIIDKLDSAAKG